MGVVVKIKEDVDNQLYWDFEDKSDNSCEEVNKYTILYSTDCPKCKVLESKLQAANIGYIKSDSFENILKLGFRTAPVLQVGNKYFNFSDAIKWLNERKEG